MHRTSAMARRLSAAAFVVLTVPGTARGAEFVTCGDYPVSGCWEVVQEAVDAAEDGDTIRLGLGVYLQDVVLDHRRLTLSGQGIPVIVGTGSTEPTITIVGGSVDITSLMVTSRNSRAIEIRDNAFVTLSSAHLNANTLQPNGGIVHVRESSLQVESSDFQGGLAARSGGQIYALNSELTLTNSAFTGGSARAGGAVATAFGNGGPGGDLTVDGCYFADHTASFSGAAIYAVQLEDLAAKVQRSHFAGNKSRAAAVILSSKRVLFEDNVLQDNVFQDNQGDTGASALRLVSWGDVTVRRNLLCRNRPATLSTDNNQVATIVGAKRLDVRNNKFVDNAHTALGLVDIGTATVENNHFVGNTALRTPVLRHSEDIGSQDTLTFASNLAVDNAATDFEFDQVGGMGDVEVSFDHNLWWGNLPEQPVADGAFDSYADPALDWYTPGAPCLTDAVSLRDPLWPSWYGAAVDAGSTVDPQHVDRDGSPLDVGAFGGPFAHPPDWVDDDGDGVPTLYDCNRDDPTIGSGLEDPPYNGIDEDCRGDDDYDADDDGARPAAYALGALVDCDDNDPRRHPSNREIPSNGIDDDCDGWADNTGVLSTGSCAAIPTPSLGWVALLGIFVARRPQRDRRESSARRPPST